MARSPRNDRLTPMSSARPVGARNSVVAGQAAFRYLLMSLSHRVDLTNRSGAGSLLVLVPDDGPVEKLASQGSDPAFGERV
ncbi:MAG: hypothetical protein ACI8Y4_005485, partial [Candidatus Poriferisodalaceae bacterium]